MGSSLDSIRLSQLVTFFNAVKHAPLRNLSIQIFADVAIPVVAGLPGLETLSIRWADDYYYAFGTTPRVDLNLCDWSTGLIQPSIDTLCDLTLDLSVGKDQEGATLNLELLKPALKLHTFSYTVANTSTDVITQLPKNLPYVKKLSLLWHSWPGEGQPGFNVCRCYPNIRVIIVLMLSFRNPSLRISHSCPVLPILLFVSISRRKLRI